MFLVVVLFHFCSLEIQFVRWDDLWCSHILSWIRRQISKSLSWLDSEVVEIFFHLCFRIARRFMLRMQSELNTVHHQPLLEHRCSTFSLQKGTSYTSAKIAPDLIWRYIDLSHSYRLSRKCLNEWSRTAFVLTSKIITSSRNTSRLTVRPTPPKQPSFVYTTI